MIQFANGKKLNNTTVFGGPRFMRGCSREALEITITDTHYNEIQELFQDGAQFQLQTPAAEGGEPEVFDKSDYCVAGDITDKRDGTFVVLMGQKTNLELLEEESADILLNMGGMQ